MPDASVGSPAVRDDAAAGSNPLLDQGEESGRPAIWYFLQEAHLGVPLDSSENPVRGSEINQSIIESINQHLCLS